MISLTGRIDGAQRYIRYTQDRRAKETLNTTIARGQEFVSRFKQVIKRCERAFPTTMGSTETLLDKDVIDFLVGEDGNLRVDKGFMQEVQEFNMELDGNCQ